MPPAPIATVARRFHFDAAHRLPRHAGRCRNLHGHGYELEVFWKGPVDADSGMVVDFADVEREVDARVLAHLDHADLNTVIENPTAELVAIWIWDRLVDAGLPIIEIRLHETPTCHVSYRGERSA